MAIGMYVGVSGKARKIKNLYYGVGGKARRVLNVYVGDTNGKARLCYSYYKYLSDLSEGDRVVIQEDGNPTFFYVAKHNYTANGTYSEKERAAYTLLVREFAYLECNYRNMVAAAAAYPTSLNGYISNNLVVSNAMPMYLCDMGLTYGTVREFGTASSIASTLLQYKIEAIGENIVSQWTSSTNGTGFIYIDGSTLQPTVPINTTDIAYYRPAIILPSNLLLGSEIYKVNR